MADTVKISELDELASGSLLGTTVIPAVDGGTTQKIQLSSLKAYTNAGTVTDSDLTTAIGVVNSTINNLSTTNIVEGSRLYYTDARVQSKIDSLGLVSESISVEPYTLTVSDGSTLATDVTSIGFSGVTLTDEGDGEISVTIDAGGTALTVSDGSTQVADVDTILFSGAVVTETGTGNEATITISAGGESNSSLNQFTSSINDYTSSVDAHILDIATFTGSFSSSVESRVTTLEGDGVSIPVGTLSSSQQITDFGFISTSIDESLTIIGNGLGITSSSVDGVLNITIENAGGGGGGEGDVVYTQGFNIISQSISSFESNAVLSGMYTNENRNQTFTNFSESVDSRLGGGVSNLTNEFNSFTQSFYGASIISGSPQIEDLGFISDIGNYFDEINNWTGSGGEFGAFSSSVDNRLTDLELASGGDVVLPDGLVSGSSQIIYESITNVPSIVGSGSINVSSSIDGLGTNTITIYADSVGTVDWNNVISKPANIFSGSGQITDLDLFFTGSALDLPSKITGSGIEYSTLKNAPTGFISSSQQITDFGFVSESGVAPQGTISSSQQIADFGYISSSIGFYSSSNQISESGYIDRNEGYWLTFSSSVEDRITTIEEVGGGGVGLESNTFVGDQTITGSVFISGALTVDEFIVSNDGLGEPIIYSATNINLSASVGAVIINSSPLRLTSYTNAETSSISATNGDLIYNSTVEKLIAYQSGAWGELGGNVQWDYIDGKPDGVVSSSLQLNLRSSNTSSLVLGFGSGQILSQSIDTYTTLIGAYAGNVIESGNGNTIIGSYALQTAPTSVSNTAIGTYALQNNVSGGFNIAIGNSSMRDVNFGEYNIAVGNNSLENHSFGNRNIAIGHNSMIDNVNAANNIGLGEYTLSKISSSILNVEVTENIAIGHYSARNLTTGSKNVTIGNHSGADLTTGIDNTFVGSYTNVSSSYSSYNTSIGSEAAKFNLFGSSNVAVGYAALRESTSGSNNVAIGNNALKNSNGFSNVAVGSGASINGGTGDYNIAIGDSAGTNVGNGNDNIAIGRLTIGTLQNGSDNIAIGKSGVSALADGNHNIAIGTDAGDLITNGSGNILIGHLTNVTSSTDVNTIAIGSGSIGNGPNTTTIGNDDTTNTYIAGNVLPTANESYDLGSPDRRWKDLYLSGSTIDLGGTLITRNINGNIEFLDSGSRIQKSIELAAITGSVYVSEKVTMGEALKLQPQHPLPSGEAGMMAVSGSGIGPFGLHFYNGSTWLEISFV